MQNRVPITVRLESFEGPLDLLLYLIQSHELDISKISITKITDQYLEYIKLMQELNFDVASEFLVMASTLLLWKSRSLLPREETVTDAGEEDLFSPEDLVRQLLEHQRFLAAGARLATLPQLGRDVFTRTNDSLPAVRVWKQSPGLTGLVLSIQDILVRSRRRKHVLIKETVSLEEKILEFGRKLELGKPADLRSLLPADPSRQDVVVTFLASLELSRLSRMRLYQEGIYTAIYLELLANMDALDMNLLTGFDAPKKEPVAV